MISFLHIICYKWGKRYPAEEVNILRASVKRNLGIPHRFHCLTDDPAGLDEDIIVHPLPGPDLPGNGPKIFTFSEGFLGLSSHDHVVSLDVDLVIVGNLDWLAERPEEDFLIAKQRNNKAGLRAHGAVYRLRVGSQREIWDDFISDTKDRAARFPGNMSNAFSEQRWLEHKFADREFRHFDTNRIIVFRKDCEALAGSAALGKRAGRLGLTTAPFGTAKLPGKGEAIVSFAGSVNPRDVLNTHHGHFRRAPFVKAHWHR